MTSRPVIVSVAISVLAIALATPATAHAYLDPTSGSMLLQLVLGGVAGIAVAIRLFWDRFRSFFSRRKSDDSDG